MTPPSGRRWEPQIPRHFSPVRGRRVSSELLQLLSRLLPIVHSLANHKQWGVRQVRSLWRDAVGRPSIPTCCSAEASGVVCRPQHSLAQIHPSAGLGFICGLHFPLKNHYFSSAGSKPCRGEELGTGECGLDLGKYVLRSPWSNWSLSGKKSVNGQRNLAIEMPSHVLAWVLTQPLN